MCEHYQERCKDDWSGRYGQHGNMEWIPEILHTSKPEKEATQQPYVYWDTFSMCSQTIRQIAHSASSAHCHCHNVTTHILVEALAVLFIKALYVALELYFDYYTSTSTTTIHNGRNSKLKPATWKKEQIMFVWVFFNQWPATTIHSNLFSPQIRQYVCFVLWCCFV